MTRLGSCTIPASFLKSGDRVDIRFSYSHEGTEKSPAFEVRWGATTVVSRTAASTETYISGRIDAGVHDAGAQWSVESWGASLAFTASAGSASDTLSFSLMVDFLGRMTSGGGSDTLTLRSFSVIRYPAQANP